MQKLRQYLCLGYFSIFIYESSVPANPYFLVFLSALYIFQVWYGNYKSFFGHFQKSNFITEYFVLSYIEKLSTTVGHFLATFWWLINRMSSMSYYFSCLNYATYFKHVQKINHCLCLRPFSVFNYGKFNFSYSLHH